MIKDIASFLNWFASVNKRAIRDISSLPDEAAGWRPSIGDGERAWSVDELVVHMAEARLYFASAYVGDGWVWDKWAHPIGGKQDWIRALQQSHDLFTERVGNTPESFLTRKVTLIAGDGQVSGWRVLMMMAEHDVHHRSQIDTYAGINGWDVQHIFGKTAEWVLSMQPKERDRMEQS